MKKRVNLKAQVSIFVIIAIVLVAVGGTAYLITKTTGKSDVDKEFWESSSIKPQFDTIKNSVQECMDLTAQDALELIGIQGGYYKEPKEFFDLGWAFIPYYYKEGQFLMPETYVIQNQIGMYVNENFGTCLANINVGDFSLKYTTPKTKASISKGEVSFSIDDSVSISKEGKTVKYELRDVLVTVDSKLYEMIEIAKFITDSHKEDPSMICISCVADMARERNIYVDMLDFGEGSTTLVVLSQNMTSVYPFAFEFLNKYPAETSIGIPSA